MSDIKIRLLEHDDHSIWNRIVDRSAHAVVFHELEWLKIAEKHTNSKLFMFVGSIGDEIIGAIPFFQKENYSYKYLSSPLGSAEMQNLGPIFPEYANLKQNKKEYYFREFQRNLDKYIFSRIRPFSVSIVTSPGLLDMRPYVWTNYRGTPRYNYVKDIQNIDNVWNGFKKELRKNILNSEKLGIEIKEGNFDSYNLIIKSVSSRYEEQGSIMRASCDYFSDLYENFYPKYLKIFSAEYKHEQISGIICTVYKDRLSIWVGAVHSNLDGIYPVDLLQWEIIKWGHENGFKNCEILGANNPSISYFKSRYNFDLELYFKFCKNNLDILKYDIFNSLRSFNSKFLKWYFIIQLIVNLIGGNQDIISICNFFQL